ncbi:GAF domain-containing protein [Limnobacter parvus]|uniref:GAF domain-containing protein n=1 Tax=Limnobacter parvus TaxID=2939690 RepID=A0ABT1XJA8_9BURK|nr:GAF domain-containing protein [Limnobacter parvus]MCR2747368.1 GAF domain-containing protein [Limnobacter parvus]
MSSPKEIDEAVRLTELYQLDILDTSKEEFFEALVDLGSTSFDCAFCFIAFVDSERVWFKAKRGFEAKEVPRDLSICSQTIKHNEPHVINDCAVHPDFKNNPLVTESPGIRSYLGVPLHSLNGNKIGTFCLLDNIPRDWTEAEITIASSMAKLVEHSVIERAIKVKESSEAASGAQHPSTNAQSLGSWKSIDHNSKIELSPSMEKWLNLTQSRSVSAAWFNDLPIAEDKDKVTSARLERNGTAFTYRVRLPNDSIVMFEEQVYGNDQAGMVRLFGLVKKISKPLPESPTHMEENAEAARMEPSVDLKRFPKSFLKESVKGRMLLDYTGQITGLAGPDDDEFFKIKSKENLIDLLHAEDKDPFQTVFKQSLGNKTPCETWVRLNDQEEANTWLRIELFPKKGFTAFKKPHFEAKFTAVINKASSMQKSVFDETLLNLTGTLAKVGGWYYHLDSGMLKTTEMLREVLSTSKESLTTIFHLSAIVSKLSGRNIAVLFIECINNRKPASLEFESQEDENNKKWFRMMIRPSIGEEGVPVGLYGSIADISESRRTELALEKNLLAYNLIVDNLTDGLVEIDAAMNVSFVNRNAKALLQQDRELFVHAMPLHELIPDLDISQFSVLLESVNQVGFSKPVEQYVQFIKRWISIRVFKSSSGYTILIKDITKRKNQSSDLYMLNSAIEQIREVIMVTNDVRKTKEPFGLLYVNSAFETFVGQGRDKWLGRNPYHLIHGRIPTRDYRQLLVAFLSRQKILLKTEYEINPDHKVPCDILISPFLDTARNAPCFLVVFRVLEI